MTRQHARLRLFATTSRMKMVSAQHSGRSSNRFEQRPGHGNEWWHGSASSMSPCDLVFFALPKKRSSLLCRNTSAAATRKRPPWLRASMRTRHTGIIAIRIVRRTDVSCTVATPRLPRLMVHCIASRQGHRIRRDMSFEELRPFFFDARSRTYEAHSTNPAGAGKMRHVADHGILSKAIVMGRNELLMMQLFGGGGGLVQSVGLLQVVFLTFLIAVPILKPERIRVVSSYRRAFIFFALSTIVPSVTSVLMTSVLAPGGQSGEFLGTMPLFLLLNVAGPVLFGISIILLMKAIVPGFIPPPGYRRPTSFDDPQWKAGGSVDRDGAESESP